MDTALVNLVKYAQSVALTCEFSWAGRLTLDEQRLKDELGAFPVVFRTPDGNDIAVICTPVDNPVVCRFMTSALTITINRPNPTILQGYVYPPGTKLDDATARTLLVEIALIQRIFLERLKAVARARLAPKAPTVVPPNTPPKDEFDKLLERLNAISSPPPSESVPASPPPVPSPTPEREKVEACVKLAKEFHAPALVLNDVTRARQELERIAQEIASSEKYAANLKYYEDLIAKCLSYLIP